MSGKQMEGDSEQRRTRARLARERGQTPSEAGVTLGASKQREHVERAHRDGAPPAGSHKPVPHDPIEGTPPLPDLQWPRTPGGVSGGRTDEGSERIQYRELVAEVGPRVDVDFADARLAAEATVTVLARALGSADRRRLLDAVPAELHDDYATNVPYDPGGLPGFLHQIATIAHRTPDQARYLAQAVLSVMREQDDELMGSLRLPDYVRDLLARPAEGGVVGVDGRTPPLTDDELRAALARLPRWSGDRRALVRTIALPPGNLERVLRRLADLKREGGRGPHIGRPDEGVAMLVVRTSRVNAVTALDVELAHRVDAVIEEAGAGMDAG
jgi:pterin-4a-carbinolamine dehydratase